MKLKRYVLMLLENIFKDCIGYYSTIITVFHLGIGKYSLRITQLSSIESLFIRYYDYYYAPLASTFACCEHSLSDFHQGTKPFSTFEQMLAIFPPQYIERMQNSALLSQAVRYFPIGCLQIMQSLPLSNIYRADAVFDPNGKHFKSQGVVKLPFVDAQLLRNALEPIRSKFTEEEQKRDAFNDDQLFVLSSNAFIEQLVSHS